MVVTFSVTGVFVSAITEDAQTNVHLQKVSDIEPYASTNYDDLHVYYQALLNSMNKANIDTWKKGEYGLSDRLNFHNVYVLDYDIELEHSDNMDYYKFEELPDSGYFGLGGGKLLRGAKELFGFDKDIDWPYGSRSNLSEGDSIFVYPHVEFDADSRDFDRWWIIQYFSIDDYGNLDTPDNWHRWEIWGSGRYERIWKFSVGTMPNTDIYYVIDMVEIDRDTEFSKSSLLIGGLVGLTVGGTTVDGSQFAKRVERYGGMIKGETSIDAPVQLSSEGITLEKADGSLGGLFRNIDNQMDSFGIFLNPDYGIFAEGMTILILIFGLIITVASIIFILNIIPTVNV